MTQVQLSLGLSISSELGKIVSWMLQSDHLHLMAESEAEVDAAANVSKATLQMTICDFMVVSVLAMLTGVGSRSLDTILKNLRSRPPS